jgi:hypothetical protein
MARIYRDFRVARLDETRSRRRGNATLDISLLVLAVTLPLWAPAITRIV